MALFLAFLTVAAGVTFASPVYANADGTTITLTVVDGPLSIQEDGQVVDLRGLGPNAWTSNVLVERRLVDAASVDAFAWMDDTAFVTVITTSVS